MLGLWVPMVGKHSVVHFATWKILLLEVCNFWRKKTLCKYIASYLTLDLRVVSFHDGMK